MVSLCCCRSVCSNKAASATGNPGPVIRNQCRPGTITGAAIAASTAMAEEGTTYVTGRTWWAGCCREAWCC